MVKFQKVLLISGCVMSLLSGIISVIEKRFDTYAFISALLFFNLYINLLTNIKLSDAIEEHVENVKKIIKK
jgi:small basic protein